MFGLGQMLLANHDGELDRRDWIGLALGGLALLCSGQAPPVILATGLAVWWRRGWRPAAFHTVPLGIIYAVWYVWAGVSAPERPADASGRTLPPITAGDFVHFLWTAALGVFAGLGHFLVVDWVLVADAGGGRGRGLGVDHRRGPGAPTGHARRAWPSVRGGHGRRRPHPLLDRPRRGHGPAATSG